VNQLGSQFQGLLAQAMKIWGAGGWAMIALAGNCLVLFAVGLNTWMKLRTRYRKVPEAAWRRWVRGQGERRGHIGRVIQFAMESTDLRDMTTRFSELHSSELAPFSRDLKFMKRAVSTAPLLGLLGTVTGMLATFQGMSLGAGGQKTMDLVAGGISEALITTETGLVIALPGLFFQYHLTRLRDRYEAFLSHLETACVQEFCRRRKLLNQSKKSAA